MTAQQDIFYRLLFFACTMIAWGLLIIGGLATSVGYQTDDSAMLNAGACFIFSGIALWILGTTMFYKKKDV